MRSFILVVVLAFALFFSVSQAQGLLDKLDFQAGYEVTFEPLASSEVISGGFFHVTFNQLLGSVFGVNAGLVLDVDVPLARLPSSSVDAQVVLDSELVTPFFGCEFSVAGLLVCRAGVAF